MTFAVTSGNLSRESLTKTICLDLNDLPAGIQTNAKRYEINGVTGEHKNGKPENN